MTSSSLPAVLTPSKEKLVSVEASSGSMSFAPYYIAPCRRCKVPPHFHSLVADLPNTCNQQIQGSKAGLPRTTLLVEGPALINIIILSLESVCECFYTSEVKQGPDGLAE